MKKRHVDRFGLCGKEKPPFSLISNGLDEVAAGAGAAMIPSGLTVQNNPGGSTTPNSNGSGS